MKKLILSYADHFHKNFLSLTLPGLYKYANTFDYDLIVPNKTLIRKAFLELKLDEPFDRPSAWQKIVLLIYFLKQEKYDVITWIDADCVINMFDEDINYAFLTNDKFIQAFCVHQSAEVDFARIPNTGVWSVKPSAIELLYKIWQQTQHINHPVWEQQGDIEVMFWRINEHEYIFNYLTEYGKLSLELPYKFNMHPKDYRFDIANIHKGIIHVTGYYDNELVTNYDRTQHSTKSLTLDELKKQRLNNLKEFIEITNPVFIESNKPSIDLNYKVWENIHEMLLDINKEQNIQTLLLINPENLDLTYSLLNEHPLIKNILIIDNQNITTLIRNNGYILNNNDCIYKNIANLCKDRKNTYIYESILDIKNYKIDLCYIGYYPNHIYNNLLESVRPLIQNNGYICGSNFGLTMSKIHNPDKLYNKNIRQAVVDYCCNYNDTSMIGETREGIQTYCLQYRNKATS